MCKIGISTLYLLYTVDIYVYIPIHVPVWFLEPCYRGNSADLFVLLECRLTSSERPVPTNEFVYHTKLLHLLLCLFLPPLSKLSDILLNRKSGNSLSFAGKLIPDHRNITARTIDYSYEESSFDRGRYIPSIFKNKKSRKSCI